jgi:diguanylate cyclase (GGDEF)-like protein
MAKRIQSDNREDELLVQIKRLQEENEKLRQNNLDLQIALTTTAEHGDLIEIELHKANEQLKAEVIERQRAEMNLRAILELISRQKNDLEIIVQTIMEHGDVLDAQWLEKLTEMRMIVVLDGLTQIPNRRKFDEVLEQQWKQMARDRLPLSIILCDIDCFKQYNDTYGHLAGDDCLKQVAQAINGVLKRPCDIAARYGGEEFTAILPQTDLAGAMIVAELMHSAVKNLQIPHANSSVSEYITLSIGVACIVPNAEESSSSLLDEADQLLYKAKQQGKNRIVSRSTILQAINGQISTMSEKAIADC